MLGGFHELSDQLGFSHNQITIRYMDMLYFFFFYLRYLGAWFDEKNYILDSYEFLKFYNTI